MTYSTSQYYNTYKAIKEHERNINRLHNKQAMHNNIKDNINSQKNTHTTQSLSK